MWRVLAVLLICLIFPGCSRVSHKLIVPSGGLEQRITGEAYYQAWVDEHQLTLPDEAKKYPYLAKQMAYADYLLPAQQKLRKEILSWAMEKYPDDPLLLQHIRLAEIVDGYTEGKGLLTQVFSILFDEVRGIGGYAQASHMAEQQLRDRPGELETLVVAMEVGDQTQRSKRADEIVGKFPTSPESWMTRARALWDEQREAAQKALHKVMELDPENAEAPTFWVSHLDKDASPERLSWLKQILRVEPGRGDAAADLSEVYFKLNDYNEALETAEVSVKAFPDYWWGEILQGRALQALGKHQEAITVFNQVLVDHPSFFWPPELRGYSRIALGDVEGAVGDFIQSASASERKNRPRPHMHHAAGIALLVLGRTAEAREQFGQLEGLWGQHGLCMVLVCERKWAEAATSARKLREENPSLADMWLLDYITHIKANQEVDMQIDTKLLRGDPWPTTLVEYLAGKSSLETVEQVAKEAPSDKQNEEIGKLWLIRGYEALKNKNNGAAGSAFSEAKELLPTLSYESILAKLELEDLK